MALVVGGADAQKYVQQRLDTLRRKRDSELAHIKYAYTKAEEAFSKALGKK
jgi:hypothetical protein